MTDLQNDRLTTKKANILFINDDDELQGILQSVFKPMNISLTGISTGKEARNFLNDSKKMSSLSLILIERILPDMDGLELLDQIIEQYKHKIPVVIISSLSSEKDIIEGLHRGAVEYITKPFNLKVLVEKIHSLINWNE
jgi:DNA-binding response OmpR family regulator